MTGLPLHPALVHIPVGLAMVLPLFAIGLAWAIHHRKALPRKAWVVVVGLLAVMMGGALASMQTGDEEGERVERVVAESVIETHEERAEAFTWAVGLVLAVALAALVIPSERVSHALSLGTAAGSLVLVALAFLVGHAGGTIVHGHMVQTALQSPTTGVALAAGGGDSQDDDD